MRESEFRSRVVEMLRPLCAFAVENAVDDGTPDVCCTAGWLELKLAETPARASTRVAVDMRASQRVFHRRWRRHGGASWTLTFVWYKLIKNHLWLLHDGMWSAQHLGMVDQNTLLETAIMRTFTGVRPDHLISALMTSRRTMRRSNDAGKDQEASGG